MADPKLREGFTTGTAAAAAASAAVCLLLGEPPGARVTVALPPFTVNSLDILPLEDSQLAIPIEAGGTDGEGAWASVIKDGGDDPDATHGARIVVHASTMPFTDPATPCSPVLCPDGPAPVHLYGGFGVGRVTLPGLPVPPGEPAINPEPRKQIALAAVQAARRFAHTGSLHLRISVPEGPDRARRSMNARLGILDGISILGTRGTVCPFSHEAWKATISQGLSVAAALGLDTVLLTTGRRSERLGFACFPELKPQSGIQVADFASHAIREAARFPFRRIIWSCFQGKLLKLAQGLEWTDARNVPADIPLLATFAREAGAGRALAGRLKKMPTAAGAFALLEAEPELFQVVLRKTADRAMDTLRSWLARAGKPDLPVTLLVFSPQEELLLVLPPDPGIPERLESERPGGSKQPALAKASASEPQPQGVRAAAATPAHPGPAHSGPANSGPANSGQTLPGQAVRGQASPEPEGAADRQTSAGPGLIHVFGLGLPVMGEGDSAPRYPRLNHPALEAAEVLIGGKAQLAPYADIPGERLVIGRDAEASYAAIRDNHAKGRVQAILCSGDPFFYGLGARLAALLGPDCLRVYPGVSSLQASCSLIGLPWEQVVPVSLHGRDNWSGLAAALLTGQPVFVLLDHQTSPAAVADWMLKRGRGQYTMHILDNLYQTELGEIRALFRHRLCLAEAETWPDPAGPGAAISGPARLRVLLLEPLPPRPDPGVESGWPFGLPDAAMSKENKLLTKLPVRAAALAALGIEAAHTVWDLGAGSGSVSVEAARLACRGMVYAVEQYPERLRDIRANRARFGAANLEVFHGSMPGCLPVIDGTADTGGQAMSSQAIRDNEIREKTGTGIRVTGNQAPLDLPRPDRIFIGGGLGRNSGGPSETLVRAWRALKPGGRLVVDCVLLSSLELARSTLLGLGAVVSVSSIQASTSSPLAGDLRLDALNPVFLVIAEKNNTLEDRADNEPARQDPS